MPRCIALFRAVNVGGRFINMEALRDEFEARMSANVTTSIASDNVIFESRARNLVAFARKIEAHLRARFGFGIHTFIRAEEELSAVAVHEAFDPAESAVAKAQVVGLNAGPLDAAAAQALACSSTRPTASTLASARCAGARPTARTKRLSRTQHSSARCARVLAFRNITTLRKRVATLGCP